MNESLTTADWLATVPGWKDRPANIVPLRGGFNNRSYRIESDGYAYVLRVIGNNTAGAIRNVERECRLQQQAAGQGLAAPVIYSDPERGLILMEYLPGTPWTQDDVRERGNLVALGKLLRRLHELPRCDVIFNAIGAADHYLAQLPAGQAQEPFAQTCRQIIELTPAPSTLRGCHNDVVAANLINGDELKLIDFEYACDNDPLFDLASVIGWHNLGSRESDWLLGAYAEDSTPERRERLQLQMRLFDALQWLWLAAHSEQRRDEPLKRQMTRLADRLR